VHRDDFDRSKARACGLCIVLALLASAPSLAQDAARGRTLYVGICSNCHADPPGNGAVDPRVRTGDEIRAAINRVSPMRFLGSALSNADLADIAAYFVTVLGAPTHAPAFEVGGQWSSSTQPWWALYLTQYASGALLTGGWLTFDAAGDAIWLYFYESGAWTSPGVYTAKLFRNTGPPFATPPASGEGTPKAVEVGTIVLVFSARDAADVTFTVGGITITHRIGRVAYPP
jgi:cytochrome c553